MKRKDILKIRYAILRDIGYTAKEASKLRNRSLDIGNVKVKEGKVVKKNNYKNQVKEVRQGQFVTFAKTVKNDTTLSNWGLLNQDERYRHQTTEYINFVRRDLNITSDQAYYFVYTMLQTGMTYKETKKELLANKEFEIYVSKSKNNPSKRKYKRYGKR